MTHILDHNLSGTRSTVFLNSCGHCYKTFLSNKLECLWLLKYLKPILIFYGKNLNLICTGHTLKCHTGLKMHVWFYNTDHCSGKNILYVKFEVELWSYCVKRVYSLAISVFSCQWNFLNEMNRTILITNYYLNKTL